MTISGKRTMAVVFAFIICGISASHSVGQETPAWKTHAPVVIKYDGDMTALLASLSSKYGATIGLEVDPKQPQPQVELYLKEATLTDILNAIVKSAPRYQWRESGGLIEVLPLEGTDPILDTGISGFRLDNVDDREAINQLVKLPEVQAAMRATSLDFRDLGNASTNRKGEKVSFNLESGTMRQALNRIAKETGARFWIFRRDSNGFFSISTP